MFRYGSYQLIISNKAVDHNEEEEEEGEEEDMEEEKEEGMED